METDRNAGLPAAACHASRAELLEISFPDCQLLYKADLSIVVGEQLQTREIFQYLGSTGLVPTISVLCLLQVS